MSKIEYFVIELFLDLKLTFVKNFCKGVLVGAVKWHSVGVKKIFLLLHLYCHFAENNNVNPVNTSTLVTDVENVAYDIILYILCT